MGWDTKGEGAMSEVIFSVYLVYPGRIFLFLPRYRAWQLSLRGLEEKGRVVRKKTREI